MRHDAARWINKEQDGSSEFPTRPRQWRGTAADGTAQGIWGDGSLAAIAHTITVGVPQPKKYGAPMPPMGGAQLSSFELSAVAAYVWALGHRSGG